MGVSFAVVEPTRIKDDLHCSYSGFNAFREELANLVGINLKSMSGHGGILEWRGDELFKELFDHSDCEGVLNFYECNELKEDFGDSEVLSKVKRQDKFFQQVFFDFKEMVDLVCEDENEEMFIQFS